MTELSPEAYAVIEGRHSDPFHYLGPHLEGDVPVVRVYLPDAEAVKAIDDEGHECELKRIHEAGLFSGRLENGASRHYRVRARFGGRQVEVEDPYRFPPILSEFDLYLLGEGTHTTLYEKLGAHPMVLEGTAGVGFVVFAPTARRVSVVGDFNFWDGRRHAMRVRGNGFWEIFVPGAKVGDHYKYEIISEHGEMLPLKADPVAFAAGVRPQTASIVTDLNAFPRPVSAPKGANARSAPMSIYEVHRLAAARRMAAGSPIVSCRAAAGLPARPWLHARGILPVTEHPFDGSGIPADRPVRAASRFGTPADSCAGGRLPPRRHRRDPRLGAGAFPRRSTRARPLQRYRALRACQPEAGAASRLEHLHLQFRAHGGRELPARERAVLAGPLRDRRPARRCGRFHALSRLQPARGRLDRNKFGGRDNPEPSRS